MPGALQPKKMLIMNILDILKKYSDADHRLSQKDIIEILEDEYNMTVDRKSIKRNLMNLIDAGYNLEYSESVRVNKRGEEEVIYTDWYLNREFTDSELRLLVDSLLFSKTIPYNQCKDMIVKLESLSNQYFKYKVRHISNLPENRPKNPELFLTIEILDEAIEKGKQVAFNYSDYGTDKKHHLRTRDNGEVREYIINPYQMVATNGRYYLICNMDKFDEVAHYRVDQIHNIRLLDTPSKSMKKVKGMNNGLNLPKHMAEHVYMFSGPSERIEMRIPKFLVGAILDWFGNDVKFTDETDDTVVVHLSANLKAMRFWALQYSPFVKVLEPQSLVDEIKNGLKNAIKMYEED